MSKRHLFYIAMSKNFIKANKYIDPNYNVWSYKQCSACGNFLRNDCDYFFELGQTSKCYNWNKKLKGWNF